MQTIESVRIVPTEGSVSQPQLTGAHQIAPPLGIYRHYKGAMYELLGVAQHSETGESLAVYRALYGQFGLWVRPLTMFQETVMHQGIEQARFAWQHSRESQKQAQCPNA